jgi:hypothetical protein
MPIDWRPDSTAVQRYTVAVNLLMPFNNGLKADFEYELNTPGEWLQAGLVGYVAPRVSKPVRYADYSGLRKFNNRYSPNSGDDYYRNMWGFGVSGLFKKMWHPRGWYFSTGLMLEFYRVGHVENGLIPFEEEGLNFYEGSTYVNTRSYFKTTAQFNVGKHFSLSKRCFIDVFFGLSYSHSFYNSKLDPRSEASFMKEDNSNYYDYVYKFSGMNGFARRGPNLNCGVRFGVLLWDRQ